MSNEENPQSTEDHSDSFKKFFEHSYEAYMNSKYFDVLKIKDFIMEKLKDVPIRLNPGVSSQSTEVDDWTFTYTCFAADGQIFPSRTHSYVMMKKGPKTNMLQLNICDETSPYTKGSDEYASKYSLRVDKRLFQSEDSLIKLSRRDRIILQKRFGIKTI